MIIGILLVVLVLLFMFAGIAPTIAYVAAFPWVLRKAVAFGSKPLLVAMAGYPLLYFAAWGFCYTRSQLQSAAFNEEMAGVRRAPLPARLPSTLLVRGNRTSLPAPPCIDTILFDEDKGRASAPDWNGADVALPRRYLLFLSGARSHFHRAGFYGTAGGTPYELRLVDGATSSLIALHNPNPIRHPLPLLTLSGWYRRQPTVFAERVDADLKAFFQPIAARCSNARSHG